jgi:hypothetical protein
MKKLIVSVIAGVFMFCCAGGVIAGNRFKSDYDKRFTITVVDCQGNVTVYKSCAITNLGQTVVSFIPDSGRISGFNGEEIQIIKNTCTQVIQTEE